MCRKPQLLDEGALRVDPGLDDFVREHFGSDRSPAGAADATDAVAAGGGDGDVEAAPVGAPPPTAAAAAVPSYSPANAALRLACRLPKLLLVGIDGCRPDCLMLADAPHAQAVVTGGGAFSTIGSADGATHGRGGPPDPMSAWEALLTGRGDGGRADAPTLFELLTRVRPWMRCALVTSLARLADRCARAPPPARQQLLLPAPAEEDGRSTAAALALLAAPQPPDVLVLQLGDVQVRSDSAICQRARRIIPPPPPRYTLL